MKTKITLAILILIFPRCVYAQGFVLFDNFQNGADAPVTFPDGRGVGQGFQAQLFGGPIGTPKDSLSPLLPVTVFKFGTLAREKYVEPVIVPVPNVPPDQEGAFFMRAWSGPSWEQATFRGESRVFSAVTGTVPAVLYGLSAFTVTAVPEPYTLPLIAFGAMFLCSRLFRQSAESKSARSSPSSHQSDRSSLSDFPFTNQRAEAKQSLTEPPHRVS